MSEDYCARALAVPLIWQWRPHKRLAKLAAARIRLARLVASGCWTEPPTEPTTPPETPCPN